VDWKTYAYKKNDYYVGVEAMARDINSTSSYDIAIVHPDNKSFIKIEESGDIEAIASDMLGIKMSREKLKMRIFGNDISIEGKTEIEHVVNITQTETDRAYLKVTDFGCNTIKQKESIISGGARHIHFSSPKGISIIGDGPYAQITLDSHQAYAGTRNSGIKVEGKEIVFEGLETIYLPKNVQIKYI
jgi:hypothetical protein